MKKMTRGEKCIWAVAVTAALALLVASAGGCASLDRAYRQEVTWTNAPVVGVFTNAVVQTSAVPVVVERTNVVYVTNATTGAVAGYMAREPVATNMVTAVVTNFVPVFYTNMVQVPVTNLVARPEVLGAIEAAGSVTNTFLPGIGSILALALGGLYHGYRQVRNRNVIHYYAEIIRENGILLLMCGRMCGILLDVKRNVERWVAAGRKNETDHHLCHSNSESNGTVGHAILGTHVTKLAAGASSFASV